MSKMNIVIPMAGEGARFKVNGYELPKPLILIDNKPMIQHCVESLGIDGQYIFIIRRYESENTNKLLRETLVNIKPDSIIIEIDKLTNGSAETCLFAKDYIGNDDELIITNCDQLMEWDSNKFINFLNSSKHDGVVVTYESTHPKNSFVKLNDHNLVEYIAEKNPISNKALIGLHYWKKGIYFVNSTIKMINNNIRHNNEFYVGPTYNELIKDNKLISTYHLDKNQYISVGSPDDLNLYLGRKNEYDKNKTKTIICDLDGTILKHTHKYSDLSIDQKSLIGVNKKFDEWDSLGYKIILMTARKESARKITEKLLLELKNPYDLLIMGVGNGIRVLINDKITETSFDRAVAVNIVTDSGFDTINWGKYEL